MLSETTQKFNEHLAQSNDLQIKLRAIKSPLDLVNIAKQEGFELSIEDLKELAQQAYQQWLANLTPQMSLFFEKIHLNPELNHQLHQCQSLDDLISLADQCGFEITASNLKLAAQVAESIKGFSFEKLFFQNLGLIK